MYLRSPSKVRVTNAFEFDAMYLLKWTMVDKNPPGKLLVLKIWVLGHLRKHLVTVTTKSCLPRTKAAKAFQEK